ncbi:unknown protein [Microcystis aeruginosa NIES-843]|uniref:Uncharacterized protein n=1 Tax=Microcystis aeruginosa (strain NIES-843 / IAM M-2473) TaxID=449447 RepID=B0JTV3_MICAN|nr:unknown protein [Microcystis aeruginosa NIES-843]
MGYCRESQKLAAPSPQGSKCLVRGNLIRKKTVLTAMPSQPDGTGTCKMGLVATIGEQDSQSRQFHLSRCWDKRKY